MRNPCKELQIASDDVHCNYHSLEDVKEKQHSNSTNHSNTISHLYTLDNIAIPLTFITIALLKTFPAAYIQYYPRLIHATDSQLSTLNTVRDLPWSFKVFYGLLSDAYPIRNARYKPYMIVGYLISSFFYALLAYYEEPDIVTFTMLLLGSMFGVIMVDVMGDGLVASRARLEPVETRGTVLANIYMCRFGSEMVGYWAGAILCNKDNWHWGLSLSSTFTILSLLPFFLAFPSIYFLKEDKIKKPRRSLSEVASVLWTMLTSRAVWQPLSFLVFFNTCNTYNAAWGNYLQVAYHFNAFQYGSMTAIGSSVTVAGIWMYRKYFLRGNHWRSVYICTSIVIIMFAMFNIALVFRLNEWFGISPYWFAVGDSAVQSFALGIQYTPSAIMWTMVIPEGEETIAFALLTGCTNLAGGLASTLSNLMLGIWPVQLEDLQTGEFDGVWKLTLLSNAFKILPLFVISPWFPRGIPDLLALKSYSSKWGGACIVVGIVVGMLWVFTTSILAITTPCLHIVGGNGCS